MRGCILLVGLGWILTACGGSADAPVPGHGKEPAVRSGHLTAIFAGGCFWCTEAALQKLSGVVSVESGYTGGTVANPTYEQVCSGTTGHYEAVRVRYDPRRIAYRDLLDAFWRSIDPTDGGGQFVDRGTQYRSAIFVSDDEQRRWAEAGKAALDASGVLPGKVATAILPTERFYPAEPYHQDYFQTNASAYQRYRLGSGRDACLARVWTAKPEPVPVWKKTRGRDAPEAVDRSPMAGDPGGGHRTTAPQCL